jgi:hypothetical protein
MRKIGLFLLLASISLWSNAQTMYDTYGGITSIKGKKTGWFHVEELNGRWFFVTPEGNAFFSLGATHSVETIAQDELNLFQTKYRGNEKALSDYFVKCFKEWGYNSSGYGPLPSMEKELPYVATIWTEGPRSHSAGAKSTNSDIFDPVVRERLKGTVRTIAAKHKDNPFCLGYVFIDLPIWGVIPQRGISYVDFVRNLPSNAPGKKEYMNFIRKIYNNELPSFNKEYSLNLSSFEDILLADLSGISPNKNARIATDDEAFLAILAESYYECVAGELRKADPNHLILGDRFMAGTINQPGLRVPDAVLRTAAKYVDVISFQPMGGSILWREYIDYAHLLTGKPLLFADTNTMLTRPEEGQANTEEYERNSGENTYNYYINAAGSPALIGIHRCTVRDYRPWDTNFHRRGLLKADDTPYPILVDYTRKANKKVYEMAYGVTSK